MKMKWMGILAAAVFTFGMAGCACAATEAAEEAETLQMAYQYGLGYAPTIVAKDKGLIEAAYKEATGKDLVIEWTQMSSGADINTAIAAGELDAGFMGVAPAITGVMKGAGYKICANLAGQPQALFTNDEAITSLEELINSDDQIAVVNIGSIQHISLALTLKTAGYDPHALDAQLVAMTNPDGEAAVTSGSIACHFTSGVNVFHERKDEGLHEIPGVEEAWHVDYTHILGVAAESLYEEKPDVYQALVTGLMEATDFLNEHPEEAAAMLYEYDGNTEEEELEYLKQISYQKELSGVFNLAGFMAEEGFLEKAPDSFEDLVFEGVKGN